MPKMNMLLLKWVYRLARLRERTYAIENVPILLPPGHLLDWYQRLHPRYDRFLPVLAGALDQEAMVVDIGANIGDSAVPFLKRGIRTWCVEPAREFLPYLRKNLESNGFTDLAVIVDKLVSSRSGKIRLKVERGTAFVQDSATSGTIENTISLDSLLESMPRVDLIKSDTDGFDHDVLHSGRDQIAKHKPLLYFENTVTPDNQSGYESLYRELRAIGYDRLVLFDNRGNILRDPASWDDLRHVNRQIMNGQLTGTPYLDVLCGTPAHQPLIDAAIRKFQGYMEID